MKYPVFLGIKVSADVAERLRQAARLDDRPLSAFVRRLLAKAVSGQGQADGR